MKINPDDPALPSLLTGKWASSGLTIRAEFAARAMQAIISGCLSGPNVGFTVQGNIKAALEYADALIAELNKE